MSRETRIAKILAAAKLKSSSRELNEDNLIEADDSDDSYNFSDTDTDTSSLVGSLSGISEMNSPPRKRPTVSLMYFKLKSEIWLELLS